MSQGAGESIEHLRLGFINLLVLAVVERAVLGNCALVLDREDEGVEHVGAVPAGSVSASVAAAPAASLSWRMSSAPCPCSALNQAPAADPASLPVLLRTNCMPMPMHTPVPLRTACIC